jgi:uncharacterized repeat protein (TIGR01451 family)
MMTQHTRSRPHYDRAGRARTQRPWTWRWRTFSAILCFIGLLLDRSARPAHAFPAGFQEYYISGNETQVLAMFHAIQGEPNLWNSVSSGITIVATADHQIVYYDHWEDGYEANILSPVQSTTEIYGDSSPVTDTLQAGDAVRLDSEVPIPRNRNELYYDCGDRLLSIGGPIDIVHSLWPESDSWLGGAWEIYPVGAWATGFSYIVPVGVDLYQQSSSSFPDFQHVWIEIQALDDNTTVHIDNGSETASVRLDRGQSYSSMGYRDSITETVPAIAVTAGTTLLANKAIQGGLVTGRETNQTRFYTLVPDTEWGTEYVAPVPRTNSREAEVYLYNPELEDCLVTAYDAGTPPTGTTFILTGTTPLAYRDSPVGRAVPSFSALRLSSTGPLWAVASADAGNNYYDWGFSFVPTRFAGQDYYVSWAPGSDGIRPDASPVWLTPLSDNTTFSVIYEPAASAVPDEYFTLDALQAHRIYDPVDGDNTGMRIYADKPFVAVWGEDPLAADFTGGKDMGYPVLPLDEAWQDSVLTLSKTPDVQTVPHSGGTVAFDLHVQASDYAVSQISITDTLPISWTYVSNSTRVAYADGSVGSPEPTIVSQTLSWPLQSTLGPNQGLTLTFQAQLAQAPALGTTCYDDFESGTYDGGSGWNGPWVPDESSCNTNCVTITDATINGLPHSGRYHLIINETGAISRSVDLSGFQQPFLRLWRRANALETGDSMVVRMYNGTEWTTVRTITATTEQGLYIAEQLDLTPYRSADSRLEVRGGANNALGDYIYLDDVEIWDAAAIQINVAEAAGTYLDYLFSSRDKATIAFSSLDLRQEVDRDTIVGGESMTYTLAYTNSHPLIAATHALIRNVLPANTTFLSASPGYTYLPDANTVIWGRSPTWTLEPNQSGILTSSVLVDLWVNNGQILRSQSYIDSDQAQEIASNVVETIVQGPKISLSKRGPASANPGQTITYTIDYANTGPFTATGVLITDIIPISTSYQANSLAIDTGDGYVPLTDDPLDADAGGFTGTTVSVRPGATTSGQIGPGESGRIRLSVRITPTTPAGTNVANYATLTRNNARPQNSALLLTAITNLTLEKRADRSVVGQGSQIGYTITLGSSGAISQTNVYVYDLIPDHTRYVSGTIAVPEGLIPSYSMDYGETWTQTVPLTPSLVTALRWYTPTISGTKEFALSYQVQVEDPLSKGGVVISNRAHVTSTQTLLLYSNEVHIPTVDLWVNKTQVPQETVRPGQQITYSLSYGNNGSTAAYDTTITDIVPAETFFDANASTPGWSCPMGALPGTACTWSIGQLDAGSSGAVEFSVVVSNALSAGVDTITNTVLLASKRGFSATASLTVPVVANAELALSKSDGRDVASPGDVITYTLTPSNTGNQHATGVVLTETVPQQTTFDPLRSSAGWTQIGATRVYTLFAGNLAAGTSGSAFFAVLVNDPVAAGIQVITNTAVIGDDGRNGPDPSPANNTAIDTTWLVAAPDMVITKAADRAALSIGDALTYTLTISNAGNQGATNVIVTDALAAQTPFIRASDGATALNRMVTWPPIDLAGGSSVTRTIVVSLSNFLPARIDQITNTVFVADDDANGPDPTPDNNTSSLTTTIEYRPALRVVKLGPDSARVGDTVAFTFTLSNVDTEGDGSSIGNLIVSDTLAGPALYLAGDANDNQQLDAGEQWSYHAHYTIPPTAPVRITNTVFATGYDWDDDQVTSSDSHSMTVEHFPTIYVSKRGPLTARLGDTVVYTITLANVSFTPTSLEVYAAGDGSPISSIVVTDSLATPVSYVGGDNDNQLLERGEIWIYTASHTIQDTDPDPLTNTVTVTGRSANMDPISETARHSLDIEYSPALEIATQGPTLASIGEHVILTYTVHHDVQRGDGSAVTQINLTDTLDIPIYVSGDNGDDVLELGETWLYTSTYTIRRSDPNPLVSHCALHGADKDHDILTETCTHSIFLDIQDGLIYLPVTPKIGPLE